MKKTLLILFSLLSFNCSNNNCEKYTVEYIPKNLLESLDYLDCKMPEPDKKRYAETNEFDIIGEYSFGLGRHIRNEFRLWDLDYDLYNFFKENDISHPEAISSIILISFHRKLNNRDIKFQEQVQEHHDYINKAILDEKEREIKAQKFYESFKINDTVRFNFSVDFTGEKKMILIGDDYKGVCKGKGIVAKKNGHVKLYGYEISIKLIDYCDYANLRRDEKILKVGDTINYYIERYNIEKQK